MPKLHFIEEPLITFNYNQSMIDPRDGLSLFGALDKARPEGIRWGIIGLKESIARMKKWVEKIQRPIMSQNLIGRPFFPGFEVAFKTKWGSLPAIEIEVSEAELWRNAHLDDKYQRVYRTVDIYSSRIMKAIRTEDVTPDIWCVLIPEYIYQNCRPQSTIPNELQVKTKTRMNPRKARKFLQQSSLFSEDNTLAEQYFYTPNFHHQLKARLLQHQVPIQIIRELKIAYSDFVEIDSRDAEVMQKQESAIAWNISSAVFYKAGGRPWKLDAAREGVCYIGLVFKEVEHDINPQTACCAAQMFLDSGDGVVFKGAVGPWYRGKRGLFHLKRKPAAEIVQMCIEAYKTKNEECPPKELFIHGRVAFDDSEWAGFLDAAGEDTKIVGVRIRPESSIKLFRLEDHPVLRGTAYITDNNRGFLWTRGMTPRLRTYPGREVPNPILVDICRGDANLEIVMADILALTKLNYNSCTYADGLPVTLKFANAVGEILTSGPARKLEVPPLPFKYYI